MIRCSDLKNYLLGDCIKDWLCLYRPLASSSDISNTTNTLYLTDILQNIQNEPREYANVVASALQLTVQIDIVAPSSFLLTYLPPQTMCQIPPNCIIAYFQASTVPCYNQMQKFFLTQIIDQLQLQKYNICIYYLDNNQQLREIFYSKKDIQYLYDSATKWLQLLRTPQASKWNIDQSFAPHFLMMPSNNLSFQDEYTSIREELAWKWRDVSLLYWVGAKTRSNLHSVGVYTLDHPKLLQHLQDSPKLAYQQMMLQHMFEPIESIEIQFTSTTEASKQAYFDIETTVNENGNLVNLVGVLYQNSITFEWIYKYFASKDDACIQQFCQWQQAELPTHTFVHYTAADLAAIPKEYQINTRDLHSIVFTSYLTSPSLQALHLTNFKLKSIYKQLCKKLRCKNLYDNCVIKHGLQALNALELYIKEDDQQQLQNVIEYNKVDCIVLLVLDQYLQNEWNIQSAPFIQIQAKETEIECTCNHGTIE